MRKSKILIVLLCCVLLMGGCVKDYDRNDIIQMLKDTYDLKKFTVSREAEEVTGDDGYTDYLWTVRMQDDSEIVFHVLDNHFWGMESLSNRLDSDYDSAVLQYLFQEYDRFRLLSLEDGSDVMLECRLAASFETRKELELLFRELQSFSKFAREKGYRIGINVDLQMESALRNKCEYVLNDGDCFRTYRDGITKEDFEEACKGYLLTCLDYRFEEQLEQFTSKEIEEALQDYPYCIGISRDGTEDGELEFYQDLCGSSHGVSFGTLYEILKREGIETEGTAWHYSFTGADGSVYEISYDFCDYPFEDDKTVHNGYYYLKDGKQVPMNAYFHNHFRANILEEMTGLKIKVTRM